MIEHEIRKNAVIAAPESLDAAVLLHARKQIKRPVFRLDILLLRLTIGHVPFLDWGLVAIAVLRGHRIRVTPAIPGLLPIAFSFKTGEPK
jgi:hypothetical protein